MPDLKISQLTDGGALQVADQIPVNRAGSNFRVTYGSTDITWADFLTAIGGSTLTPLAWYHITDAPDGSTTIDEAWVRAKDANEIFPDGECLVNAANITNRIMQIKFFMAGGVGGKIAGVYDGLKNVVEGYDLTAGGTSTTANISAWLDLLTAANQGVKIYSSVCGGTPAGTINNYSELLGATMQIEGSSNFFGVVHHGSVTLAGASNANGVYVLGGGSLNLDNSTILANGFVGAGKSLTIADGQTYLGFSTEGNTKLHEDGTNASGDTVTVDAADGVVYIVNGVTDITINMPTGLIAGQQMMIYFKVGSAAVTWGGAPTEPGTFIAAPAAESRIMTFWDASGGTWR